jgi:dCMP deaminase
VRAQVGAVIVTKDNRVQAASYNGPPPNFKHRGRPCSEWCPRSLKMTDFDPEYDDCFACHAEENAIARSDWTQLDGATLVVTGAVCFKCAKLISQTGIVRVIHRVDATMTHRHPEKVEQFLKSLGIIVERA